VSRSQAAFLLVPPQKIPRHLAPRNPVQVKKPDKFVALKDNAAADVKVQITSPLPPASSAQRQTTDLRRLLNRLLMRVSLLRSRK
jgi:hypothetical protein